MKRQATSGSFKKGDPRINRKGRPKEGETLAAKFRDALAEALNGDYTRLDSIIDMAVQKAMAGDQAAIEYTLARGFGKLIDRSENVNLNKQYDFSNIPLEERRKVLEALRLGTIPSDNPDVTE